MVVKILFPIEIVGFHAVKSNPGIWGQLSVNSCHLLKMGWKWKSALRKTPTSELKCEMQVRMLCVC